MRSIIDSRALAWSEISMHIDVYRNLILEKIKTSPPPDSETGYDEKGYWEHELKALNNAVELSF